MPSRGQSEALGYVIVFALIVGTVSFVTVTGLGELRDIQDAQRDESVLAAMDILADTVDELVVAGAPLRETELKLGGGDLSFADPVTITVSGHKSGETEPNFSYAVTTRPLIYDGGTGHQIVYNAGGVFWQSQSSTSMTNGPPLLVSPDGSTVTIVQTRRGGETAALGGTSTVLVRAHRVVADLYQVNHTATEVTVHIDSPRADAWGRQLDERAGVSCSAPAAGEVSCAYTTDRVSMSVVRIDLILRG